MPTNAKNNGTANILFITATVCDKILARVSVFLSVQIASAVQHMNVMIDIGKQTNTPI